MTIPSSLTIRCVALRDNWKSEKCLPVRGTTVQALFDIYVKDAGFSRLFSDLRRHNFSRISRHLVLQ